MLSNFIAMQNDINIVHLWISAHSLCIKHHPKWNLVISFVQQTFQMPYLFSFIECNHKNVASGSIIFIRIIQLHWDNVIFPLTLWSCYSVTQALFRNLRLVEFISHLPLVFYLICFRNRGQRGLHGIVVLCLGGLVICKSLNPKVTVTFWCQGL